jgi:hypothetical protein
MGRRTRTRRSGRKENTDSTQQDRKTMDRKINYDRPRNGNEGEAVCPLSLTHRAPMTLHETRERRELRGRVIFNAEDAEVFAKGAKKIQTLNQRWKGKGCCRFRVAGARWAVGVVVAG